MNKDNKNTELDNTDKKLHISDVSDSTKSQYKAHFIGGFENHAKLLAMKMERYEKFVKFYQLK